MPKFFTCPTGTVDILPQDHSFYTFIKKIIRHRFRQAGFGRITPPIFEEIGLFNRSLGSDSEILKKELYSFSDRQGREYALRPELTTSVVRSFIENEMYKKVLPIELYYIEPCFRFERPKKNTQREFWQFGAEILGESDPALDAQIIYIGHQILSDLQIFNNCELRINSIGNQIDQKRYMEALANFYAGKERSLSAESKEKLAQKKYFDLLDPKTEDEEILVQMAPKITDFLSEESKKFFDDTLEYLKIFNIDFTVDPTLFRLNNYYSHTIFEFKEKNIQNKILVGGRYDDLIEKMGGPQIGAVGFSAGLERIINIMKKNEIKVPNKDHLQIFLAATGNIAKKNALPILIKLREQGFHAVGVLGKSSMQTQLEKAQKFNVPYTLLMGDLEVKKKQIIVRDMKTGKQKWIDIEKIVDYMKNLFSSLDSTVDFLGHE